MEHVGKLSKRKLKQYFLNYETSRFDISSCELHTMKDTPDINDPFDREEMRLAIIRATIDRDCERIVAGEVTRVEAIELIESNRNEIRSLIGDRMYVYDMVIVPRFHRLIEQFLTEP